MTIKEYVAQKKENGYSNEDIENDFKIMREYPEVFKNEPELEGVIFQLKADF